MFTRALECAVQGQLCFLLENLAWFPLFPMELTAEIYTTKPPLFEALRTFFTQLHSEKVAPNFRSPFMAVSPSRRFPPRPVSSATAFAFPLPQEEVLPLEAKVCPLPPSTPFHPRKHNSLRGIKRKCACIKYEATQKSLARENEGERGGVGQGQDNFHHHFVSLAVDGR